MQKFKQNRALHRVLSVMMALLLSCMVIVPTVMADDNPPEGDNIPIKYVPEPGSGDGGDTQSPIEDTVTIGLSIPDYVLGSGGTAPMSLARAASGRIASSGLFYDELTNEQKQIYSTLKTHFLSSSALDNAVVPVNYSRTYSVAEYDVDAASAYFSNLVFVNYGSAISALIRDCPQIWFLRMALEGESANAGTQVTSIPLVIQPPVNGIVSCSIDTITVTPVAYEGADTSNLNRVQSRINQLSSQVSGTDRYEKLQSMYQIIARNLSYVTNVDLEYPSAAYQSGKGYLWSAASILEGEAVCEGYAKTLKMLCDKAGIPCVLVSGYAYSANNSERHMWNVVKMEDDNWYALDITWDDIGTTASYDYFLVGGNTIIDGSAFEDNHDANGQFSVGGRIFNYPPLSEDRYDPSSVTPEPPQDSSYNVSPQPNADGWYRGDITITPTGENGYNQISTTNGGWQSFVTITGDTANGSQALYLYNGTDAIQKTFSYKLDATAPIIGTPTITQTKDVLGGTLTVPASDATSGVKSITVTAPDNTAVEAVTGNTFAVTKTGLHAIRVTDNADNTAELIFDVQFRTVDSIAVTDSANNPVTSPITFSGSGQTVSLSYAYTGDAVDGDDFTAVWASSDPKVASVSSNGVVTALAAGRTRITVTALGTASPAAEVEVTISTGVNTGGSSNTPSISIPEESLPSGVTDPGQLQFVVAPVAASAESALRSVAASRLGSSTEYMMFDMSLDYNGQAVQPGGNVIVTIPYPSGTTSGYTFTILQVDASGAVSQVTYTAGSTGLSFTVDSLDTFIVGYQARTTYPSGSRGGSSRSSGGTTWSPSSVLSVQRTLDFTQTDANTAYTKALSDAKAAGSDTVRIRVSNYSTVSKEVLASLASKAKNDGMKILLNADVVVNQSVTVRISLDPAQFTTDLNLGASIAADDVAKVKNHFENFFQNKVHVIKLEQAGSFGAVVEIAAKLDLTGFDKDNLYFYSYSRKDNTYTRIESPSYWVDTNGYLHFNTALAGDLIVSNGPLQLK